MRGRTNEPAFLPHVGAALAAARGETADQVAASTRENTIALFSLAGRTPLAG
jgi:Tat protein secretion system quality control protein TatD with DNase activity